MVTGKVRIKSLFIAAALATGTVLLSACGSSGSGGASSGSGGAKSVTATYMASGTYNTAAQALAPSFAKQTGDHVSIDAFPYAALRQNNTNAVISGSCEYNVVSGSYYLADIYGYFQNLDSYAVQSNYPGQLIPGLWAHSESYNGHHIGLPYGPDAYALIYRTDLFKQAGLQPPKTWQELASDLGVLKAKFGSRGIAPLAFPAGEPDQLPALFFADYGSYFINSAGKFALDPAAATSALEFAQQLLKYMPSDATTLALNGADDLFTAGKAAVLYGWPSFIVTQADAAGSPIARKWAVMPTPSGGLDWLSLWQMYMTSCTSTKQAAWKWMTTFSSPATDKTLFVKYGVNPSFQATYTDPQLKAKYSNYFPGELANLAVAKNPALSGEAQDFLASEMGNVITGHTSAAHAVAAINADWANIAVPKALLEEAKLDGEVQQQ